MQPKKNKLQAAIVQNSEYIPYEKLKEAFEISISDCLTKQYKQMPTDLQHSVPSLKFESPHTDALIKSSIEERWKKVQTRILNEKRSWEESTGKALFKTTYISAVMGMQIVNDEIKYAGEYLNTDAIRQQFKEATDRDAAYATGKLLDAGNLVLNIAEKIKFSNLDKFRECLDSHTERMEEGDTVAPISLPEEEVKENYTIINGKAVQNNSHNNTETFNNSTQIFAQPEAKRKLSNWGQTQKPASRGVLIASNEKRKELERSKRAGSVHSTSRINIGGFTFDETRTGKGRSTSRGFSMGDKVIEGKHPPLKRVAKRLGQSRSSSQLSHTDQLEKRTQRTKNLIGFEK